MKTHRYHGYSILEVLIGIAIFAIGMIALASLQGNLSRSASDANARTTAINLAEQLIENRRGFARITDATNTWPAYDDITNEVINQTVGGITYTITSTVTNYYYSIATDSFTTTVPATNPVSDYKLMSVNVSWSSPDFRSGRDDDATGVTAATLGSGSITVADTLSSFTSAASSVVNTQIDDDIPDYSVTYTPGNRPEIISLSLGNNKFKESLTPEPDVIRADELVETRFDVITYSQDGSGALFVRREEFAAVSCECDLKAAPGADDATGRRPVIWAGDEYVRGHVVNKPYGVSANNQQSSLCTTCCRDHHDGGSSADDHSDTAVNQLYPFRSSGDYWASGDTFNGDHKHYKRSNRGVLSLATNVNDTYVEACRLVRVDGFFRVAQDFRQEDVHVFPANFLDDASEVTTYSNYVTTAADDYENATSSNYETSPPCIGEPSPCVEEPTYGADYPTALAADEFPVWTQLPLDGEDTQQLRSRGVYIDYLSDDMRAVIDCLRAGGTAASCQTGDVILDLNTSTNILELIPFFDVQLTFLNRWTETPTNTPVDTTNEGLEDSNAHSRGVASKDALGGSDVEASGHMGNLGFTDTLAIDFNFASETTTSTIEAQALDSGGGGGGEPEPGTNRVVSGFITESVNGLKSTDIEVVGVNGALCDRTVDGYECEIPDDAVNPRVKFIGYGSNNTDRWTCFTQLLTTLTLNNEVTNGSNAEATFNLYGFIAPSGSGYDINVQSSTCSLL